MPDQIRSDVEFNFEQVTVDSENKILRNVVLCGHTSKNGYSYPPSCFRNAEYVVSLYEGKPVCIDHNPDNPAIRGVRDVAGFIRNVRLENGKPVGDIEVESAIDCGVDLLGLAAKKRKGIGMSHVAKCKMARDKKTVELVEQVVTVDVVVNPATTNTFFEQDLQENHNVTMEELKAELDSIKGKNAVLESDLAKATTLAEQHKSENDKLLGQVTALRTELDTIKPVYEQLQSEQKKAADLAEIQKMIQEAGLNPADEVVVSENFMNILLASSPEARASIINDRKTVVGVSHKGSPEMLSPERRHRQESTEFRAGAYIDQFFGGKN